MHKHVIVYKYKRAKFYIVTKPCTMAEAQEAYDENINRLKMCKLVIIYEAAPANLAALERMYMRGENVILY